MTDPLYSQIPKWILKGSIDKKLCTQCDCKIKKEQVIAIGIRTFNGNSILFLECQCYHCKYREVINVTNDDHKSLTVEDLCFLLLESVQKQKSMQKSVSRKKKKKSGGKITDKEVSQFLEFMNKSEHYEDLLKHLNISINKHGQQNTDED